MRNIAAIALCLFLSLFGASMVQAVEAENPIPIVNINTAKAETLVLLKGVGERKAQAIVSWRDKNGKFTKIEQLANVKGIGESILEANRKYLVLK